MAVVGRIWDLSFERRLQERKTETFSSSLILQTHWNWYVRLTKHPALTRTGWPGKEPGGLCPGSEQLLGWWKETCAGSWGKSPTGLPLGALWSSSVVCVCVYKSLSYVQFFVIPWTVANQTSLSTGSSRQEYWNGLPFPSPEDLPNPGIEPRSPTLQADSFPSEPSGKLTYNGESLTFQIPIFLILNSTIFNLCEEIHIFFGLPKQNSFLNHCQVQKDRNREKKTTHWELYEEPSVNILIHYLPVCSTCIFNTAKRFSPYKMCFSCRASSKSWKTNWLTDLWNSHLTSTQPSVWQQAGVEC